MNVARRPLPSGVIEEIVAAEDAPDLGIERGETLICRCRKCAQADETKKQIVHREDCDLAGEHGRALYDTLPGEHRQGRESPELVADHEFAILKATNSTAQAGVTEFAQVRDIQDVEATGNNDVVGFWCVECGNGDERLFHIIHDHGCSLQDVNVADSSLPGRQFAADGGTLEDA